jgi:hypothetical protein
MLINPKTNQEVFLPRNASTVELMNVKEVLCPPSQHHGKFFQLQTRTRIKQGNLITKIVTN